MPLTLRAFALFVAGAFTAFAANRDRHVVLVTIDGFPAYLWRDESIPLPNLRRLAAEGASVHAMTISNPALTWPNHTTLVTGVTPRKHGVLFNGLVVRGGPGKPNKIEPWVDRDRLVLVPTVYDAAFHAGLTTAEVDWVAITRPKTITWSFAEIADPTAVLPREMVSAGVASAAEVQAASGGKANIVWRDELWTRAACFVFKQHRPNLLLFHPLNTDSTHHRYGPGSLASMSALALADRLVGELLHAIEASGEQERTTVIVTTDHGFKKVDRYIHANVALKQAGLLRAAGPTTVSCDVFAAAQGGAALVYITDPARRAELLPKVRELFARTEGVAEVIDAASGAAALGMPTPAENAGMGDLILYAKPGFAFSGSVTGDAVTEPTTNYSGSHGFPAKDPDLDGIFIAHGAGIKPHTRVDRIRNIDVAPTIAHLLGVPLPNVDGRVLSEILEATP